LPGYHGLYSNINGAHIYPNDGSYGAWKIVGSRNGYNGFEFDSSNGQISLMVNTNSNTTGFHNNSYGWQFRWENGTLYCHKNSYGGGTVAVVLDSSNYTSYAATSAQGSNADTAYGWGNHAGLYLSLAAGGGVTGRTDFKELGIKADGSDTIGENGFFRWTNTVEDHQMLTQLNAENGLAFWSYGGSSWANVATLSQEGNFTVSGTITEQSSIRYKENIVDLEPVTDKVYALRPVRYNKIGSETQEIGLIAEEVAELFPEVVHYNDEGQPESLNYTRLSVLLLQTVKELSERIQKLENK